MNNSSKHRQNKIIKFMEEYCRVVKDGLDERWKKFDVKIYETETYEVIAGLLSRQATLTTQLAMAPQMWNGHIAPLILRSMTDVHITLAWILLDPKKHAKKYILYGLGQVKLFIEYLKTSPWEQDKEDEIKKMQELLEDWLNSQRLDFLTEVNVGSWSGLSTREMASEAGCESLYKFAYMPFSGPVHNMWQHVSVYNLVVCRNPLHKFHKVPKILDVPLDPDFVYRSAKYVDRSYMLFDETFKIKIKTPMPYDWFVKEIKRYLGDEKGKA